MRLKHLFVFHAVVALGYAAAVLAAPKPFMSFYGISLADPGTTYLARLFAAALLIYSFVAWLARDSEDSVARRAIVLGFFLTEVIALILSLIAQLSGVMNAFGWSVVATYLVFMVGYGYFYFLRPDTT
jgi:hypothetical protein